MYKRRPKKEINVPKRPHINEKLYGGNESHPPPARRNLSFRGRRRGLTTKGRTSGRICEPRSLGGGRPPSPHRRTPALRTAGSPPFPHTPTPVTRGWRSICGLCRLAHHINGPRGGTCNQLKDAEKHLIGRKPFLMRNTPAGSGREGRSLLLHTSHNARETPSSTRAASPPRTRLPLHAHGFPYTYTASCTRTRLPLHAHSFPHTHTASPCRATHLRGGAGREAAVRSGPLDIGPTSQPPARASRAGTERAPARLENASLLGCAGAVTMDVKGPGEFPGELFHR